MWKHFIVHWYQSVIIKRKVEMTFHSENMLSSYLSIIHCKKTKQNKANVFWSVSLITKIYTEIKSYRNYMSFYPIQIWIFKCWEFFFPHVMGCQNVPTVSDCAEQLWPRKEWGSRETKLFLSFMESVTYLNELSHS